MMADEDLIQSCRIAASFRDPSGYVFTRQGRVFRAIDDECTKTVQGLIDAGLFEQLLKDGLVVDTWFVEDPELLDTLSAEHPGHSRFLEHAPIAPITYPPEWSLSALADAATHTLDLQIRLLRDGYSLKDASAYNILFVDNRPVFIDIPSIERPARLDIWRALGQFNQMFTYPLLLFRYHGWDFRSYFLGSLGGRDLDQVARGLGRVERWRPRYLLDVTLPAILQRRANQQTGERRDVLEVENRNDAPQRINLQRLRRKIQKLADGYRRGSHWSGYTSMCSYDDQAETAKKDLVRRYLESARPGSVLDLGCNTGEYSAIAAECGARVIAADTDHDSVDFLYRRLRSEPAPISPIVLDICNPTPSFGHLNRERTAFLERLDVDCLLALALVHHLHVSGNLSLVSIRDLFLQMTKRDLVLEFVPTDDVMFRRLTTFRQDLYGGFTLEACRSVFAERFDVVREDPIPGSPRTLFLLRKRG